MPSQDIQLQKSCITKRITTSKNMGLTTWKYAPDGRILKSDVSVAKNYLSEEEIRRLERAVTGFFDYIEDLIERENSFTMADFSESVDAFLNLGGIRFFKVKELSQASKRRKKLMLSINSSTLHNA